MAQATPESGTLKYWWTADDAPVNSHWVDRVSGLKFRLYGSNIYDSVNKIYDFGLSTQYGQLNPHPNESNFSMGNHFRLDFDVYFNRDASANTTTWFDMGSVTAAEHAIGFGFGYRTTSDSNLRALINWKLNGGTSNPFPSDGPDHPALPLEPADDFAHAVGYYEIFDGGNGFDKAKVVINGRSLTSAAIVPHATYGPKWNQNVLYIGRAYAYETIAIKIKHVKIWVYD